jgi:hypothetical protein
MIFVHFSIKLWVFKIKFFIEQWRHSKHISDGEYMCDKISCLRSYFNNFSTLLQPIRCKMSQAVGLKPKSFLRGVGSLPSKPRGLGPISLQEGVNVKTTSLWYLWLADYVCWASSLGPNTSCGGGGGVSVKTSPWWYLSVWMKWWKVHCQR